MTFISGSAVRYERVRPGYDSKVVRGALEPLQASSALELAAGTGKLTESLLAVPGLKIVCSEPDSRMAAELRRKYPDLRTELWLAEEALERLDAEVELVLSAQSLHFFDLKQFAKALRTRHAGRPFVYFENVAVGGRWRLVAGKEIRRASGEEQAAVIDRPTRAVALLSNILGEPVVNTGKVRRARLRPDAALDLVTSLSTFQRLPVDAQERVLTRTRTRLCGHKTVVHETITRGYTWIVK